MAGLLVSPSTPVVVTGGGSGIGRESARALAEAGRPVAAWDLNAGGAAETAAICADLGVATFSAAVDVRDLDAIRAAVTGTLDALGGVGGLVHAAGVPMGFTADDLSTEEFRLVLSVNLEAEAVLVRELLPALRDANPGSAIVGISSIEGLIGHGNVPAYTASKHALIGLTRSLAARLGPEGIRINACAPATSPRRCSCRSSRATRRPGRASSARSPSGAWATRRRSGASCASCCPTTRATSTAERSWPTGA